MTVRMAAHPVPTRGWSFEEFMQYIANAGLTDFMADECEQHQILTNIFVQSFTFFPRNNPPEVSFDL